MLLSQRYFIGADIGTTGCRVCIYGTEGDLAASASAEYPLHTPRAGWAEQDPTEIEAAFRRTLKEAVAAFPGEARQLDALVLSTVLHSIFPVDAQGEPLAPMLTWADTRAQACLKEIRERTDVAQLYADTGCPLHPMYPLAKIVWYRRERPDVFAAAHKFVAIKDWLVHRLTGQFVVDRSIASGTGLYDIHRREWNAAALSVAGIDDGRLSTVVSTTTVITSWSAVSAGVPAHVPFVVGASDGVLSTLGAGAAGPGEFTAMIGTSGAVRLCSPVPRTDPSVKNWCYNLTDDMWVLGGAINNGGLALRWARDTFAGSRPAGSPPESYENLIDEATRLAPTGAHGLVFLPQLSGERSPHWNANARGVLFGLSLSHGRPHILRATLEGVLYSMFSVYSRLRRLDPTASGGRAAVEIRTSGSFTRSAAWVQMMADVFGEAIVVPGDPEGSAFGASALGMVALGALSSTAAVRPLMGPPRRVCQPLAEAHDVYRELFDVYERVTAQLTGEFDRIAELQNRLWTNVDARP